MQGGLYAGGGGPILAGFYGMSVNNIVFVYASVDVLLNPAITPPLAPTFLAKVPTYMYMYRTLTKKGPWAVVHLTLDLNWGVGQYSRYPCRGYTPKSAQVQYRSQVT
jgi:hypothetical protein